jgi:hypothetical protein
MAGKKKYSPCNWSPTTNGRGKKCPYCCGRNGEEKDTYETREDAENAACYVGNIYRIPLRVYPCPHSSGWHLTKDDADDAGSGGVYALPGNRDIPQRSSNTGAVPWEYESAPEPPPEDGAVPQRLPVKKKPPPPIVKIACQTGSEEMPITGKIMEVIENIDAAAYFGVNGNKLFAAAMIKDLLNKPLLQITIHATLKTGQTGSYTILIDRAMFKQNNMAKGGSVSLTIKAKTANNKKAWYCSRVQPVCKPR